MTELELIIDLHKNSDRQGPGSEKETLKALGFIHLPNNQKLKLILVVVRVDRLLRLHKI